MKAIPRSQVLSRRGAEVKPHGRVLTLIATISGLRVPPRPYTQRKMTPPR